MSRAARTLSPTGLYHVTSRAIKPLRLFQDAVDCAIFRDALALTHSEDGPRILAYCLMGTHFHLVLRAEGNVLPRSMGRLKGWYAHKLNRRRSRTGPVFDQRYHAVALATESHACAAVVYLAVNPVRAGICARPELWPFGSHRAHAGLEPCPPWLEPVNELGWFQTADSYGKAVDHAVAQIGSSLLA